MITTDELGEYDDEAMPDGVALPIHVDHENLAICFEDNGILARYAGATIETSVLLQEKRKAEFVCKLASGDLIVRKDKKGADHIFRRVKQSLKDGRIVIEYEELKSAVAA